MEDFYIRCINVIGNIGPTDPFADLEAMDNSDNAAELKAVQDRMNRLWNNQTVVLKDKKFPLRDKKVIDNSILKAGVDLEEGRIKELNVLLERMKSKGQHLPNITTMLFHRINFHTRELIVHREMFFEA